jgi:DNA-binding transcriptional LysR family regulator
MELRHLRYFLAVCDTLHFGRAAEMLHIAQPALSQQIRNLEIELGVDLFSRTKRNVELTIAGVEFAKRTRFILGNVKSAVHEVRTIGGNLSLQLRVGILSSIQLAQLVPLLAEFRVKHPEVMLRLMQMPTHLQLLELTAGALDVGFVDATSSTLLAESHGTAISSMDALTEELVVAVPAGHHLAGKNEVALDALVAESFILTQANSACSLGSRVRALCDVAGFTPSVYCETSDLPSALALVASGYGVTLSPACAVTLWEKQVSFVSLVSRPTISVAMIWRSEDNSVPLETFCRAVSAFPIEMLESHGTAAAFGT